MVRIADNLALFCFIFKGFFYFVFKIILLSQFLEAHDKTVTREVSREEGRPCEKSEDAHKVQQR